LLQDNGTQISFQEMAAISQNREHSAVEKLGYMKILNTCQKAIADGTEYARIDSYCIDKTSCSEQSEAINTMY
jgi:hypothetical protein